MTRRRQPVSLVAPGAALYTPSPPDTLSRAKHLAPNHSASTWLLQKLPRPAFCWMAAEALIDAVIEHDLWPMRGCALGPPYLSLDGLKRGCGVLLPTKRVAISCNGIFKSFFRANSRDRRGQLRFPALPPICPLLSGTSINHRSADWTQYW